MFGQKPAFGASQTPSFSSFGQSAFSKTQGFNTAFAPQNSSVFGSQQPLTSTGLFASATPNNSQQAAFGSSFGPPQQQQQQQTSLFGSTNTTPASSLFGNQASAFSKPATGFGFGQPQQSSSLFGQQQQQQQQLQQPQQQQQSSLFGQSGGASTGLFGSGVTASNSAFGQSSQNVNGTSVVKFQPPSETDTLVKGSSTQYVQTKQQCITFMKEYAEKSLEELRYEDYSSNRKGPQSGLFGNNQASGMFGGQSPSATTSSLFGQTSGVQSAGLFGSTNNNLNNSLSGTSAFASSTNPAAAFGTNSGLFGKPLSAPSVTSNSSFGFAQSSTFGVAKPFGQTPQTTSSTSLFGGQSGFGATSNSFGAAPSFGQSTAPSLFGNSSNVSTGFGGIGNSIPGQTGFVFGSNSNNTATSNSSIFAPKPAFNATNAFGSTQATPSNQQNAFSGFGAGTSTGGSSLFSGGAKQPFGSLGQQNTATNNLSFGQNTVIPFGSQSNAGNLFGSSTNASGIFGSSFGATNAFGTPSQPSLLNSHLQQKSSGNEIHQKIMALSSNPYGENDLFKDFKSSNFANDAYKSTNPLAQKAFLDSNNTFKISPNQALKVRVRPFNAVVSKKSLFDGLEENDPSLEGQFAIKSNPKRLIIKPHNKTTVSELVMNSQSNISKFVGSENDFDSEMFTTSIPRINNIINIMDEDTDRRVSWLKTAPQKLSRPKFSDNSVENTVEQITNQSVQSEFDRNEELEEVQSDISTTFGNKSSARNDISDESNLSISVHPTGIILKRSGYYTIPSLDELVEYIDENGQCFVPNFTIGRRGYGNVFFDEVIDVSNLNLDEICHFRNKEIILYQDDEKKPPVGQGLNRKAQVTLDNIWPYDKSTHEPIKDLARLEIMSYEAKLRRICEKREAKFLEYRAETGSCVFKVDHFSKYSLDDSDDDTGVSKTDQTKKAKVTSSNDNVNLVDIQKAMLQDFSKFTQIKQIPTNSLDFQHDVSHSHIYAEDPPSIDLAKKMRTDAQKLQLMKASFFEHDDVYSSNSDMTTDGQKSPDQMVPILKQFVKVSNEEGKDMLMDQLNERDQTTVTLQILKMIGPQSQPLAKCPRLMPYDIGNLPNFLCTSSFKETFERNNVSIPFFMGRKFKIGWTKGNGYTKLSLLATQPLFDGHRSSYSNQAITIQEYKPSAKIFKDSVLKHLQIELNFDKKNISSSSECCWLEAGGEISGLHEHHQHAQKCSNEQTNFNEDKIDLSVWSLVNVLWSKINEELEQQEHSSVIIRRHFVSNWLQNVITSSSESSASNLDYLDRLTNFIMCNKISEACELALNKDDLNLSLLIAQTCGGLTVKQLVQDQIYFWNEIEASEFIDERRLKILMIIGGISNIEGHRKSLISVFDNLSWLKCFGLQLWFISSSIASISEILVAYERNFENNDLNVAKPFLFNKAKLEVEDKYFDIRYHLLKLYSQQKYSLEALLHPRGYTSDTMDYTLSFLILQVLESLGYRHVSEFCKHKIYKCFAEQLENNGYWEWSIFIMLHLRDDNYRESAIEELLYRHIRIDDELTTEYSQKETFIIENLQIPAQWIYWSKAIRASAMNNRQLEIKYLLKAKHWNMAHGVMIQHIMPDLIINDHKQSLKSLLKHFQDTGTIQCWNTQGKILQTYINLDEKFDAIIQSNEIDWESFLQQISPDLSELSSMIRFFPCPTAKHRLCQSEIAKKLAFIIRKFYASSSIHGIQSGAILRTALDKLPLPQESGQQEMKHIMTAFLLEKLKTN